jgi:hypothetical protein
MLLHAALGRLADELSEREEQRFGVVENGLLHGGGGGWLIVIRVILCWAVVVVAAGIFLNSIPGILESSIDQPQ